MAFVLLVVRLSQQALMMMMKRTIWGLMHAYIIVNLGIKYSSGNLWYSRSECTGSTIQ